MGEGPVVTDSSWEQSLKLLKQDKRMYSTHRQIHTDLSLQTARQKELILNNTPFG